MDYDDVPNILAPFHRWCCRCSTRHTRLPRNDCPSIALWVLETPLAKGARCVLSSVWPNPKVPTSAGIRCAYERGLSRRHQTLYEHLQNRKSEPEGRGSELLYRLPKRDSDTRVLQTMWTVKRVTVWWPCRLSFIFRNFHTDFSGNKLKSCAESA